MKDKIHPKYNDEVKAICACGHEFMTGSTEAEIKVEVCSNCHPFYTGKQKLVDVAGRVDAFNERLAAAKKKASAVSKHETDKKDKKKKEDKTVKIN